STWSWAAPTGSEHYRVWHRVVLPYVEQLRKSKPEDREPLKTPGRPIPIAGDEQDRFEYHDTFQPSPRFMDDAGLSDLRALRWTGKALEVKPDRTATLTYAFESPFSLHDVQADLAGDGPDTSITLRLSADGKRSNTASSVDAKAAVSLPEPPGAALHRFRLQVVLSGKLKWPTAVSDLRVTARVEPPAVPQITLTAGRDGKVRFADDFRSQLYLHAGRVSHPEEIKWQGNALRMYGKQGYANEAAVDYHFVCDRPLREVKVKLACVADRRNWGASASLALSRDGDAFQPAVDTSEKDPFRGELTAELGGEPAREFWVRIVMRNVCGVATAAASPMVEGLVVEGQSRR
ncbi:MAG: hypothetical protein HYU66_29450, partial [Armatimonadetes bacterium]|nr:hypothetical protein [Armatimonadota bacterium]